MPTGERHTRKTNPPGKRSIRAQLERITASPEFDTSQRSADFLRFVVTQSLTGRANEISQFAIAGSVFGRGDEFDPTTDPIVRMQAGRVRRSLEHYYLTAGAADTIVIELPRGSYVPVFAFREPVTEPAAELPDSSGRLAVADIHDWPTILVSPLRNLTGRQDADFIAQGLASDLAAELSRDRAVHVFLAPLGEAESSRACPARFELAGTVALRGDDLKINLHLLDQHTGRQTWAQTYYCPSGTDAGGALDKAVQTTVATIAEEHGILSQHLREQSRRQPHIAGKAYEAILRYHHFDTSHKPQAFLEALAALREAVQSDPDCAVCWSYLARLGASHWSLGVAGEAIPIEDSLAAARRGVGLAPSDVRCRVVLAYVLLLVDEIDQARREAENALQLSGLSIFLLDSIGYLLTLAGDWDRGADLIRKAVEINPFPRRSSYSALWLDALRRDDPAAALAAAREYAPEVHFWSPLMEAVALVANDRVEQAATAVQRLLQLKPDFAEHAHWLVTRYVKFDDLYHRIEGALATAGLKEAGSRG